MVKRDITGLTFGFAAKHRGFAIKGYRVFVLDGEDDTSGKAVATGYELKNIVSQHPNLRSMRVASEEDYYGETIIRLRSKPNKEVAK